MTIHWPAKDPNDDADYELDWSGRLDAGDTIVSSVWTLEGTPVPTSITIVSSSFSTSMTKIFVSGGTEFQTYFFRNTVTTAGGAVLSRDADLWVKSQ